MSFLVLVKKLIIILSLLFSIKPANNKPRMAPVAADKFKEVKSRLFDYKSKAGKENKQTHVQPKPISSTSKVSGLNKGPSAKVNTFNKGPSVKAGVKRRSTERLTSLANRRHSEIPNKIAKQHKATTGILKRKSCIGSFDLTDDAESKKMNVQDQSEAPVFTESEPEATSSRRLSFTVCDGASPVVSKHAPQAPTQSVAMATPGLARNVRFRTPPTNSRCAHEHKKIRKTPGSRAERRFVDYISHFLKNTL